ncbi:hypothetical protein MUK42_33411 [Musa troglodytarum]|uniref:Uncharacterized protein n=1 Tax=Musa troglodytarum TaxID=320322 RepID=A0A9E7IHJ9_9LILI|nr:hypothetical protein MUK42_33411 [Musa troglodytarum]
MRPSMFLRTNPSHSSLKEKTFCGRWKPHSKQAPLAHQWDSGHLSTLAICLIGNEIVEPAEDEVPP